MRVWVSGASGFVGHWLLARFEAERVEVIGIDREVDVRDASAVERSIAAARPDALVHLAALTSVAESFEAPEAVARVNFLGTANVLRAVALHAPRARVVLISSGEIYGSAATPEARFDETAPLRPGSPYARTKAAADLLGRFWAERDLDVVRARPFNHLGPGQRDVFVASSFARQIAEMKAGRRSPELRVGNLDAVRDFSDVTDVVDAYWRLLDPRVPPGAYNVASGVGVPVRWVLDQLLACAGVEARVEIDPARWRPTSISVGDPTRIRQTTGWSPSVPLEETLRRLLDDWRHRTEAT